jgi:DNA repair protein RadC
MFHFHTLCTLLLPGIAPLKAISFTTDASHAFQTIFELEKAPEEFFYALFLNIKNRIIGAAKI